MIVIIPDRSPAPVVVAQLWNVWRREDDMNPWWIVLPLLACTWAAPMIGIRQAGFPWWFFVCVGCLWCVVVVMAAPLYDLGTYIRRKLGMTRLADWGARMKPCLLPPARLALLIMAAISFAAALI